MVKNKKDDLLQAKPTVPAVKEPSEVTPTEIPEHNETPFDVNMRLREEKNFNTGWLFAPYDYDDGYMVDRSEETFEQVCVPHTNKLLQSYKGEDFQSEIDSYRFVSWYRRHFVLDDAYADKNIYVEFEGVATVADIYVNGEYVGNHKGAYTGFTFDITDYIKTDGSDNVIAVRVDSTKQKGIPPEGGNVDYCLFGGIVRNVKMIVTEKVHIEDITITTPGITEGDSRVHVKTVVENSTGAVKDVVVEAVIKDQAGNVVAKGFKELRLDNGAASSCEIDTEEVKEVKLWSVDDPNLYTVEIKIRDGGIYTDMTVETFGFRWFTFTDTEDESAFYLNGKKLTLRGINRHEQWPWIGRSANDKLQASDADLIKKTGLNAVRCSHYPQSKAFLKRCDEIGLIVLEEAPGWQHIGNDEWKEIYIENIKEMITRDKNHPSIISWGVRVNESFDSHELYEETNRLARTIDPTRPTHGVRRMESYNDSECQEDIFCVNYKYPDIPRKKPFIIGEHSMDWFSGDGCPGATDAKACAFIKSFGDAMNYYYGNKFCAGGFGWSMFDYNNEVNYTKSGHVFYSGLYDIFRYEKPVSYLYRSQKDVEDEPVLYIANYWLKNSPKNVMVFSNCDEVELFVNDRSVGRQAPNTYENIPHPAFTFKNVKYEEGELKAVGYVNGKEVTTHVRNTPKEGYKLVMSSDYNTLIADGSDFTQVIVELVDENGTVLPYDKSKIKIAVSGPGTFIGEEEIELEGGHIGFIVQSKYDLTGVTTCTASLVDDERVQPAEFEIEVKQFDDSNIVPVSER